MVINKKWFTVQESMEFFEAKCGMKMYDEMVVWKVRTREHDYIPYENKVI